MIPICMAGLSSSSGILKVALSDVIRGRTFFLTTLIANSAHLKTTPISRRSPRDTNTSLSTPSSRPLEAAPSISALHFTLDLMRSLALFQWWCPDLAAWSGYTSNMTLSKMMFILPAFWWACSTRSSSR